MAGTPTTNYQIPTYAATDAPDLEGAYNQAMEKIDGLLKTITDRVDQIERQTVPKFDGQTTLTVADLAELKLDDNGYAGKTEAE